MITAETPRRSSLEQKYSKCVASPPVSPSTIIGLFVTFKISSIVCRRESGPIISASGCPFDAESVKLLSHKPSNSRQSPFSRLIQASFPINPLKPLWVSIIRAKPFFARIVFSFFRRCSGLIRFLRDIIFPPNL